MEENLQIEEQNGIYYLRGFISEGAKLDKMLGSSEPLIMDLENVNGINSLGIKEIITFLNKWGTKRFEYLKCPVELIYNLNLIPNLLGNKLVGNGRVTSMLLPFYCQGCSGQQVVLCKPEEFQVGEDTIDGPTYQCNKCGTELEPEGSFTYLLAFMFYTK